MVFELMDMNMYDAIKGKKMNGHNTGYRKKALFA
jgi:hypothetical protein